jgi:ribonuclease HI
VKASRHAHKRAAPRPARLFAEPEHAPETARDAHIAEIDGAARGNPGPASYAVILRRPDGRRHDALRKYVGHTTNNVAEYFALIAALDYAHAHHVRKLRVRSDSELLVRQMQGRYKVKSPDLRPLHERARKLAAALDYFSIEHVRREQNREADALANQALDETGGDAPRPKFFSGKLLTAEDLGAEQKFHRGSHKPRRVRATYRHGALHPAEPLDLAEDAEVEITIHKRHDG